MFFPTFDYYDDDACRSVGRGLCGRTEKKNKKSTKQQQGEGGIEFNNMMMMIKLFSVVCMYYIIYQGSSVL